METVEVKLLKYTFRFKQMRWREVSAIKYAKGQDRTRVYLAHALTEISGLKIVSPEDAIRVLDAIPMSVLQRVLILYRGNIPPPQHFSTTGLYKAPATSRLASRIKEVEEQREGIMDRVEREMEAKFGREEIRETLENERLMLKNSKMRGATQTTPDENKFGATPPPVKFNVPAAQPVTPPRVNAVPVVDGVIGNKKNVN